MISMQTQDPDYWASPNFKLTDGDIEQIYNFFLEVGEPQKIEALANAIVHYRVSEENRELQRRLRGRTVYQPKLSYTVDEEVVFPSMQFKHGAVTAVRDAVNPQFGTFQAVEVTFENAKTREFAAGLDVEHPLNEDGADGGIVGVETADADYLADLHSDAVAQHLAIALDEHSEFIRLADDWFIKAMLADINIGHLHLSEAVLEISGGGPLPTPDLLVHLDMDSSIPASVQEFSLNYGLLMDERFDEVAPPGNVTWFLRRMQPQGVRETPERLVCEGMSVDRALLGSQLLHIERDIDDEWSDLVSVVDGQAIKLTLPYHHLVSGTLPLSSRIRPFFPLGITERQIVQLVDDQTGEEFSAWVVADSNYIYGLKDWYEKNKIPAGGYINLTATSESGRVKIGCDRRRRERKEYIRLAYVEDGRLRFELKKRGIGCDYDDLMIVDTDAAAAVDVLFRQDETKRKTLAQILASIIPDLSDDGMQNAVHAKTIYSAMNMLRRVPPAVIFAELVRHPAFVSVGEQYWQFDDQKWQR